MITFKMKRIMETVLEAADTGVFLNIKSIHEAMNYSCAYGSLRVTLRTLNARGFVEKTFAGTSTIIKPTALAYAKFRAG